MLKSWNINYVLEHNIKKWCYLCSDKRENNKVNKNVQPVLQTGEHKNETIMEKTKETIEMLQYQLRRYKAMRKGAACQSLQYKLQKLMSQPVNA